MRKIFLLFIAFLIMFAIFGCSSSGKLSNTNKGVKIKPEKTGIINENFDPSILNENELELKKTISPDSKFSEIDDRIFQAVEKEELPKEVDGFRVQICAVADEGKAMQVQRDAIIQFINNEVYMDYHAPYYKVRIGNCVTRFEAEQLQQLAMKKGFTDAWVVRTKVKSTTKKDEIPNQENEDPPN